jgi:hypothetical protein
MGHHQVSGTMKTNELSKKVRDKVVEKYRVIKKLSEILNIPQHHLNPLLKNGKNMAP